METIGTNGNPMEFITWKPFPPQSWLKQNLLESRHRLSYVQGDAASQVIVFFGEGRIVQQIIL